MTIPNELLDELLKNYKNPEDLIGEKGILRELTKRLLERAMSVELDTHLGYEKNATGSKPTMNRRNGSSQKTIMTRDESVAIEVPRDRDNTFEPQIVKKHQRRFDGFDDKIISMYSYGMTTRDIQAHLQDIYGVEVSPELISNVTDGIMEDVIAWQNRPLERVYPILYLDCIVVKCREDKMIRNKSVFLALAVNMEGQKELLGMWIAQNEGAKFWLNVVTELKNRGVEDIYIACVDGLKGFPEAINSVFPFAQVQLCIVHQIRNSLKYVPYKEKKQVATDLKTIYGAPTESAAQQALEVFASKWDSKYPTIGRQWRSNWPNLVPFFEYPEDIRRAIYTTNAIESLNHSLRKITKNRGVLPNDEAVFKLLYLAIRNVSRRWTMPIHNWKAALSQFAIKFSERFTL
jgi:putative transposase